MFIYNGKFSWLNYASNETFTVVFPAGFALNDPVSAYWQETPATGKVSIANAGVIHSISMGANGYRSIHFSFGYYTLKGTVAADYTSFTLTMASPSDGVSNPFTLAAMHINPASIPSVTVYMGALQYLPYATSEMAILVVPYGITEGAFVGLYFQWTVDGTGVQKANHAVNATFHDVAFAENGTVIASFCDGCYTYNFTFGGPGNEDGSFIMSNPEEVTSPEIAVEVVYRGSL